MNDTENDKPTLPEVLTADDLALLLRVDRKTVYEAARRGQIPGVRRVGARVLRWSRDVVLEWLRSGQVRELSRRKHP
jgi:excisionase family DNA binding protein